MPCRDQLHVELLNDEIIVILPATTYGVVYYKPTYSPQLLVKDFLSKNDIGATITQAEFLARALQAANAKARELGWIVLEENWPRVRKPALSHPKDDCRREAP